MHFFNFEDSKPGPISGENNSERPVDALAENGKLPTHLVTTSNQEMLAHLKKVFDTEPSREGGHWVREGVADRSGHWTRVDQGQSTSL